LSRPLLSILPFCPSAAQPAACEGQEEKRREEERLRAAMDEEKRREREAEAARRARIKDRIARHRELVDAPPPLVLSGHAASLTPY
jgi:hypothetical protein